MAVSEYLDQTMDIYCKGAQCFSKRMDWYSAYRIILFLHILAAYYNSQYLGCAFKQSGPGIGFYTACRRDYPAFSCVLLCGRRISGSPYSDTIR